MTHSWIHWTILAGIFGTTACTSHADRSATAELEVRPPPLTYRVRPCRNDVLYVDVPVNVDVPWISASFIEDVAGDLASAANAAGGAWFCGFSGCLGSTIAVEGHPVLDAHPATLSAADAHLRFFRFTFSAPRIGRLTLRESSACVAVATLRSSFELRSGSLWDRTFYTGRECDARAMSLEAEPSQEMIDWHLRAIGLDASALANAAPLPGSSTVDLASIDTGVTLPVAQAIGVEVGGDFSWGGELHVHGTGMSLLQRQLTPTAAIADVRALGGAGHGTSEHLARAIESAIFSSSNRPLIMNMSLGWPGELASPALLTGAAGCATHEDPFGEPIRYLLDVARRIDESGARPVFVAAAAGNRPYPVDPQLFPPPVGGWIVPECAPAPSGPQYFFPAEWERVSTCRKDDPILRRNALAVSAISANGARAVVSIDGGESPLVAPGEQVVVAHASAPYPPEQACLDPNVPADVPSLPAAFTGSSVSAALVAGAAARAQAIRIARGEPPLHANTLAGLLYLSGVAVERTTFAGTPVRRLNVPRLEQALIRDQCAALRTCAGSSLEPIPPGLLQDCRSQLAACGLETLDAFGNIIPNYPPVLPEPLVSRPGYFPDSCLSIYAVPDIFDESTCPGGICPDQVGVDRNLIGSLGPQPAGNGCPWCFMRARPEHDGAMVLELSAQFPAGTSFSSPYLKVSGKTPAGVPKTYYVELDTIVPPQNWLLGKTLTPTIDISAMNLVWSSAQAELSMKIAQPGQVSAVDVSPILIEVVQ